MVDSNFVPNLANFATTQKDNINEETMELLEVYFRVPDFNPAMAKRASSAAEGLCKFVRAMYDYHEADKVAAPLRAEFAQQDMKLSEAQTQLAAARASSKEAQVFFFLLF